MKIGIMSMQRVCNKGSFLQAYGLKKMIESLGHDVEFVDYKVHQPILQSKSEYLKYYKIIIRNTAINLFMRYKFLRNFLPEEYKQIVEERADYKNLLSNYLGISDKFRYHTSVDILIVGSDEVFNCTQLNPEVGYSLDIFGKNNRAKKLISYAASFGNTTYDRIQTLGKTKELSNLLSKFNSISVRDQNSYSIIKKLIGISPIINLDPVLMYDFMSHVKDEQIRKNYIIVYAYRDRITKEEAHEIKAFALREGKTIISVSGMIDFCDEHLSLDPFQCLNLFRHADYVITDTFHGTIFSIINRKKFVTIIRNSKGNSYGNQEKLKDLLNRLNLRKRSYSINCDNLRSKLIENIDYDLVFERINYERERTVEYLNYNICK